jgi:Ala-tRNA(Pro) deacylase
MAKTLLRTIAMPTPKLKEFLDAEHIRYVTITHSPAYTASQIAESAHIPGKELAKTVVVRLDQKYALAVLPASTKLDLHRLEEETGAKHAELASEIEFQAMFPGCELGAMPPFGNLYGLPVYCDTSLKEDKEIAFNAGTHTELIRLAYDDFERLVQPTVIPVSIKIRFASSL